MVRLFGMAMAVLVSLLAFAAPAQAQATIRCESIDYQQARCPVNLYGGGAAFLRQDLTNQQICGRLGTNWGWDERGIWVKNGCRAVFAVKLGYGGGGDGNPGGGYPGGGYPGGGYPGGGYVPPAPDGPGPGQGFRPVRCQSFNYQPTRCPVDVLGPPHILQQISGQCVRTQTWDFDRGGITVRGGCGAIFAVPTGYAGGGGYPGAGGYPGGGIGGGAGYPGGRIIECRSLQYQPTRCPAFTGRGVRIDSVIKGECIQGRTWGFDRAGIWVNSGCQGRFRTY